MENIEKEDYGVSCLSITGPDAVSSAFERARQEHGKDAENHKELHFYWCDRARAMFIGLAAGDSEEKSLIKHKCTCAKWEKLTGGNCYKKLWRSRQAFLQTWKRHGRIYLNQWLVATELSERIRWLFRTGDAVPEWHNLPFTHVDFFILTAKPTTVVQQTVQHCLLHCALGNLQSAWVSLACPHYCVVDCVSTAHQALYVLRCFRHRCSSRQRHV